MKKRLIIIGASGHGKVVADIAVKMNKWQSIVFVDDDESIKMCMDIPVIGKTDDALKYKDEADFFVAVGNNATRERIQTKLEHEGASIATLVHPDAVIGYQVSVGIGTVIMAGAVINSSSTIGKGCIINTNSSVDHDCILEDYVHVSPGAILAGTVKVGKGSWIGIGSVISNNINICAGCMLGAGAVVIKDITEPGTYVGVPARRIGYAKDTDIGE
ncbi:MAG: acetyltransferase [Hungateiclostridium thermocellum]|nr:acetyltransferase [Acetivibrio thermocellus]